MIDSAGADLVRSALGLAARGWHVFPCSPAGKRPGLRGNWQLLATTDQDSIRAWWDRAPYNIGVACGPSGLVVIDLDLYRRGQLRDLAADPVSGTTVLAGLCDQHRQPYPLPTYAVETPSGGCHLYYAAPSERIRNSAGRLGPLIDVRASHGYVVGAGSRIGGRTYTTHDERPPAALPAWIAHLLQNVPRATSGMPVSQGEHGAAYAKAALQEESRIVAAARPGTRNDTLNRAAFSLGQLAAAGLLSAHTVATALTSAAENAGLPAEEARSTVRSGMNAGSKYPRNARPARRH